MNSKKLIIIPAFNEHANLKRTIKEIQRSGETFDILVIDDGSTDGTALRARECRVAVISLVFNVGIGGAVQTGLRVARDNDYDAAVRLDADGQHDAAGIRALLEPISRNEADVVVGSRFLNDSGGYRPGTMRRAGIYFLSGLISRLTNRRVTDPTSGFCAWNRKGIATFAAEYPVDFPEPESIVMAARAGLRVKEVPALMHERNAGISSIHHLKSVYYMLKVTLAILLVMIKKRKGGWA